ncbi:MAG: hypothetical protein ACXW27_00360 [Allosphingosinicella sp.]
MQNADLKPLRRWTRRPFFSPSQMLTAQQLNTLMDGQRTHSERLMRALHGQGVIFGFGVNLFEPKRRPGDPNVDANRGPAGSKRVKIGCGMALDRHGRLLHWPEGILSYREIVNEMGCAGTFTLSVHYAERRSGDGGCGPCADKPEWIEEGVVFTLTRGCEKAGRACPAPKDGTCVSWDEYICSRTGSGSGKIDAAADLEDACELPGSLCRIDCSDDSYDPKAGIPIACVEVANLAGEGCPEVWGFTGVGATCDVRPYVYRTPLLYELIRGCQDNLARVQSLSWEKWCVGIGTSDWQYEVHWADVAELFRSDGLTITFTRPIKVETVHPGSVFLTARYWDPKDDYFLLRRIPARLRPKPEGKLATQFQLIVDPGWIANEFGDRATLRDGGVIELTVRGQMLRDGCDNMLNAAPLAYEPATPAQSCPGGDFVAIFSFGAAPPLPKPKPNQKPQKEAKAPEPRSRY